MLNIIVQNLKAGGLVIYPTETAYAIGCDATNQKAVDLVFKIKKRSQNKTLPLIAGNLEMVKKYCQMSAAEERLAKRYWPGALTMVLDYSLRLDSRFRGNDSGGRLTIPCALAKGIVAKDGTVAIRVSSHKIAQSLAQKLGCPIVSTSANISGEEAIYDIEKIIQKFKKFPVIIINSGKLKKKKPSLIVRVMEDNTIKALRQGEIRIEL